MRLLLCAIALVSIVIACGGEPVLIATEGKYHPYNFINDKGEIDGLERELGEELCKRSDLECEWVIADWERMITGLLAEEYDVILEGMSITDKRRKVIDFTEACYPPSRPLYLATTSSARIHFTGKVGVSEPTIYSDYLRSIGKEYMGYPTSQDLAEKLLAGEVDSILVDHGYGVEKRPSTIH